MNNRRKLLVALGAGALTAPFGLFAQQTTMPVIGFLSSRSPGESAHLLAAFRQGLGEAGFVEGQNVAIEYRWAEGKYERLPEMASEFVRRPVSVIATAGGSPAALAAKAATKTIPVVFLSGGDVIKLGLVASFNRPGGNMTGVTQFSTELAAKRLELLHELTPSTATFGLLVNPNNPNAELEQGNTQAAARTLGRKLFIVSASSASEVDSAFVTLTQQKVGGLSVSADPFLDGRRAQIVVWTVRKAVPSVYAASEYAEVGGLMSYGISFADSYRQAGAYTGRILKGARPDNLPVLQPTKFELVVNMNTANALGIKIPNSILVRATKVIE